MYGFIDSIVGGRHGRTEFGMTVDQPQWANHILRYSFHTDLSAIGSSSSLLHISLLGLVSLLRENVAITYFPGRDRTFLYKNKIKQNIAVMLLALPPQPSVSRSAQDCQLMSQHQVTLGMMAKINPNTHWY